MSRPYMDMECPNCKQHFSDDRDLPHYLCSNCGEWFDADSKPVPTLLGLPIIETDALTESPPREEP